MAEEDFEGEEPEFEGGGGGGRKKLLMIVIPILLVVGGAAGAYFSGLADPLVAMITGKSAEEAPAEEHAAEGAPPAHAKEGEHAAPAAEGAPAAAGATGAAVFYDLPEMLVNINTAGRTKNFLKMRVSLELANETDINRIENVLPRIVDNFQVYLRELRLEDLQGAAGMYRLREELLNRVNAAVRPAQVKDVLFKEMIVQ
ncbi:MAG: flagellar basal body-associated FliL family protein [Rhodospirillaceae bacterium]|nr:flagellar basal body-associated FliL family protein [Rhodospirillaceae bacterium]